MKGLFNPTCDRHGHIFTGVGESPLITEPFVSPTVEGIALLPGGTVNGISSTRHEQQNESGAKNLRVAFRIGKILTVEKSETRELSIRRIIAALDVTKKCEATLDYAARFAKWYHASLCAAYVFWPRMLSEGDRYYLIDRQQGELRRELDQLVRKVRRIVPWCKSAFLVGHPVERIATLARDSQADLVITSSYDRRFVTDVFGLGKAVGIAREAPCPVLAYPEED